MENGSSNALYGPGSHRPAEPSVTPSETATTSEAEARLQAIDAEWRRAVMESIDDGMLLFDADGLVLEMNQAFVDLFRLHARRWALPPSLPLVADGGRGRRRLRLDPVLLRRGTGGPG